MTAAGALQISALIAVVSTYRGSQWMLSVAAFTGHDAIAAVMAVSLDSDLRGISEVNQVEVSVHESILTCTAVQTSALCIYEYVRFVVQAQAMLQSRASSYLGFGAVIPKWHGADHEVCDLVALLPCMLQGVHRVGIGGDQQYSTVKTKRHKLLQPDRQTFLQWLKQ